jgi:tetratricopeptide (TPR) repeat protein
MKYIEGDTLKARLNQGPLSSVEIDQVINSVGSALAYAHRQGILHRDVKPSNVMIATDGKMYLADFGLARIADAGESTMSSDSIMGTPQYISPEQAMGKKDLDAGTDIYSFGVMLYEMVVGQVPFSADTPFSIIHDHIYTPLPLPRKVNPNVPEPVQRVLLKALAKDRLDRYQKTEELIEAFKASWIEAGIPMQGTAITMRHEVSKASQTESKKQTVAAEPKKHRSPWIWVGAGTLALLCLAVVFVAILKYRPVPQVVPSPLPTASVNIATPTLLPPINTGGPNNGLGGPTPENTSPEVNANMEQVKKDPGNPEAHLKLSLALWDSKQIRPAMEELAQAANLAGPANKEFLAKAATEFKNREAWVPAAGMYLRLIPIYRGDKLPKELEENMYEAIYKSAEQKDMPLFVFFERIDNASLPLGYIARGRYALYNGTPEDAKAQLANAQKVKPDLYENYLLMAEIEFKTGNQTDAKKILLSLSSDLGAPEWIRFMAENYLSSMK